MFSQFTGTDRANIRTGTETDCSTESKLGAVLAENLSHERPHFAGASPQAAAFFPRPTDYYRQYAGFVIKGRRVIYVNGFYGGNVEEPSVPHAKGDKVPGDWRHTAQMICDGGSITFGVEYYPDTGTFSSFSFNGRL